MDRLRYRGGGGNGFRRGLIERAVAVFRDDEGGHQITPRSRSLPTSSPTDATRSPDRRFSGGVTSSTFRRGAGSMPKSLTLFSAIGFLRAFIIFGSEA